MKIALRRYLYLVALLALLFALVAGLGSWLRPRLTRVLDERLQEILAQHLQQEVKIGKIDFHYPDRLELEEVVFAYAPRDTIVYLKRVYLDLGLRQLLFYNRLHIDDMSINGAKIKVDERLFSAREEVQESIDTLGMPFELTGLRFTSLELELSNDLGLEEPLHLELSGEISHIRAADGSFEAEIDDLWGRDLRRGTRIEWMQAQLRCRPQLGEWVLEALRLRTEKSFISASLCSWGGGVALDTALRFAWPFELRLESADLALWEWVPYLSDLNVEARRLRLRLRAEGYTDDFCATIDECAISEIGDLRGSLVFQFVDKPQYALEIEEGRIDAGAIVPYFSDTLRRWLPHLGEITYQGILYGGKEEAQFDAQLLSDFGALALTAELRGEDLLGGEVARYAGHVVSDTLRGLSFIHPDLFALRFEAEFKGRYREHLELKAQLPYLEIGQFTLSQLYLRAHYEAPLLHLSVELKDPRLLLDGHLELDLPSSALSASFNVRRARLDELRVAQVPLELRTQVEVQLNSYPWTHALGYVQLKDTYLRQDTLLLYEPFFKVKVEGRPSDYGLRVESQILSLRMHAELTPWLTLKQGYEHFLSAFSGSSDEVAHTLSYQAEGRCHLDPLARYVSLVAPYVPRFSQEARFEFNLKGSSTHYEGQMQLRSDTLRVFGGQIHKAEASIFYQKHDDGPVSAGFKLRADRHEATEYLSLKDPFFEARWLGNSITFEAGVEADTSAHYARLKAELNYEDSLWVCSFSDTHLKVFHKSWYPTDQSAIILSRSLGIKDLYLKLEGEGESISLHGQWMKKKAHLRLGLHNFQLHNLAYLFMYKPSGSLDGEVFFNRASERHIGWNGSFRSSDLSFDSVFTGATEIKIHNSKEHPRLINLSSRIARESGEINIKGQLKLREENHQLSVDIHQMPAEVVTPFLRPTFSHLGGEISGSLRLDGRWSSPRVDGSIRVSSDGYMLLDYLQTPIYTSGAINFSGHNIWLNELTIKDKQQGRAEARGYIQHSGLEPLRFNLDLDLKDYQVMNTHASDHEYFYGQGYASGNVELRGTPQLLQLRGNLRTEAGTRIYLPIQSDEETKLPSFIRISNGREPTQLLVSSGEIQGATEMTLDLDVLPGTFCELITQEAPPEHLRFLGEGNLRLKLNKSGDVTLFGAMRLTQGTYRISLYELLSKDFSIDAGSTIQWNGDPWAAEVEMKMRYTQLVSSAPLKSYGETFLSAASNIEAHALIGIKGQLRSPSLSFNVEIPEFQNNSTFLQYLNSDEQARKQQVMSLIFLRRFASRTGLVETVQVDQDNVLAGTGEILSGQINTLLSNIDEDLLVNMDLSNQQISLSYAFLRGRLRVQRAGTLLPSSNQQIFAWVGNWNAEYILSKSGKWRLRGHIGMLPNTLQNSTPNQSNDNTQFRTGVRIRYLSRFDRLFSQPKEEASSLERVP